MCGFFLIAETDFKKSTLEILQIYRNRDVVEKSFDNLKNELDKIKCLDLNAKSKPRLLNPISKTAREILTLLQIPSLDCIA